MALAQRLYVTSAEPQKCPSQASLTIKAKAVAVGEGLTVFQPLL